MGTAIHGHPPAFRSIPPEDWRNVLAEAASQDEVLAVVRDYLALWSPEEIARLPAECRPGRMKDDVDVSRWAYCLAAQHCSAQLGDDDDHLVTRMLVFTTQAAMRLAEVVHPDADGD